MTFTQRYGGKSQPDIKMSIVTRQKTSLSLKKDFPQVKVKYDNVVSVKNLTKKDMV